MNAMQPTTIPAMNLLEEVTDDVSEAEFTFANNVGASVGAKDGGLTTTTADTHTIVVLTDVNAVDPNTVATCSTYWVNVPDCTDCCKLLVKEVYTVLASCEK